MSVGRLKTIPEGAWQLATRNSQQTVHLHPSSKPLTSTGSKDHRKSGMR